MAYFKKYLHYFTGLLGLVGGIFCLVCLFGVWYLGARVTRTTEKIFDQIGHSLTLVQERVLETQQRVSQSKLTTKDIVQSLKVRAAEETRERLFEQLNLEGKAEQLATGLRQADQWLETSEDTLKRVQQILDFGSTLGAPMEVDRISHLLERLDLLRLQLRESLVAVDEVRVHAADNSLKARFDKALQLVKRVALALGEVDIRLGKLVTRLTELQANTQYQQAKILRWVTLAKVTASFFILWMGAGQVLLCLQGWRVAGRIR